MDKIIISQPLKKRRVTQGESDRNLQQLYREIYECPFEPDTIGFQNEDDDDDDAAATNIQLDEENQEEANEVVDDKRDYDVPEDPVLTDEVPKKQKFKSADEVCNEDNYNAVPEHPEETFRWSNRQGEHMEWTTPKAFVSTQNPRYAGRRAAKDLPMGQGPTPLARKNCDTVNSIWRQMITDEDLMRVVELKNKVIKKLPEKKAAMLSETDEKTQYNDTSVAEIKAFFGVLYMRGALRLSSVSIDTVFYHATSNPIFSAAFGRKRFSFLCQFIQIDDESVRKEWCKCDKFAAFCDFLRQSMNVSSSFGDHHIAAP